jgi:23S rRNA (cytidine1920-2'-O)/16S rRNA (cytidine1409-2'-O)-methyltransferase
MGEVNMIMSSRLRPPRLRADRLLVERGLYESRTKAQAAIAAGGVSADGAPVRKPSDEIACDAALAAAPAHPFVSRGGVKLAAALDACAIDVADRVCLDVGASTGGFTQALLERGARLVYAVDVGRGQLHPRLAADPRVVSMEATDIRALDPARLTEQPSLVVADVSFISLRLVLPAALALAAPACRLVALIKPQFEAGRQHLKKGIVRNPQVHAAVCDDIAAFTRALGCAVEAILPSPIEGGDGNREFLLIARRGAL